MKALTEGKYIIRLKALHKELDETSEVANYFATTAIITKETNLLTMTLMMVYHETILGLQIEDEGEWLEATEQTIDEDLNRRYELFELTSLSDIMTARVQYELGFEGRVIKSDEEVRLEFDTDSLEKVE